MFKAYRIQSTVKPLKFESLNNGIWYYNYDITEKPITIKDIIEGTEQEEIEYEYTQVRINGRPTLSKCYSAILEKYKNEDGISLNEAENQSDLIEDIYYNIKVDFGLEKPCTQLQKAKNKKIKEINKYDTSSDVNSFYLNGFQVWLNKDTRVGLMNSLNIERASGKEESTLWFNDIKIIVKCDAAIQMLSALELYALECYNKTSEHKVAVNALNTIEEVESYDYTVGYPTKLNFTIE